MQHPEFLAASSNSQLRSIVVPIQLDERSSGRGAECIIHRRVCLRAWLNLPREEPRGNLLHTTTTASLSVTVVVVDRPMISCHLVGVVFPTVKRIQKQVSPTCPRALYFSQRREKELCRMLNRYLSIHIINLYLESATGIHNYVSLSAAFFFSSTRVTYSFTLFLVLLRGLTVD